MDARELPPISVLCKAVNYDPASGIFTWRQRGPESFAGGQNAANRWNPRYAGAIATSESKATGYLYMSLKTADFERKMLAHRVAWKIAVGEDADGEIDHINGNKSDNRIANLRVVERSANARNLKTPCTNTSGVLGVRWVEQRQKWVATIQSNGRSINLGRFSEKADAIAARKAAEAQYGFHANHGRDAA